MTKFEEELSSLPVSKSTNYAEYWNKAQLLTVFKDWQPLQAMPVVPECVAEFVSGDENELSMADRIAYLLKSVEGDNYYLEEYLTNAGIISQEQGEHLYAWATNQTHETILKLWNGFTVEKPQLFYIELPNVYGLKNKVSVSKVENGTIVEFSNGKNYALKLTEQEIKSIDERYWQFAVPVEDGE
jgi:hypothetical protein